MARVREKQILKRKQETLDIAVQILLERGYSSLNMDELAEEVGISKPTLYQYFESKDELVALAMARIFDKIVDFLDAAADQSPLEQIEAFLRKMLRMRYERRPMFARAEGENMRLVFKRFPVVIERLTVMHGKVRQVIERAQEQGEIDPALPAWIVVNSIFSLQAILHTPFMKDQPVFSEEELSAVIEHIIRMFRRSVTSEKTEVVTGGVS